MKNNSNTATAKFFALWDKQTGRYLQTGINSMTKDELKEAYLDYIAIDTDAEDLKMMQKFSMDELANLHEFALEDSNEPFEEEL